VPRSRPALVVHQKQAYAIRNNLGYLFLYEGTRSSVTGCPGPGMKAVTMNHSSRAVRSTRRGNTTSRRSQLQCIPAIGSAKRWETRVRVGKESLPTAASSNRFQRTRSWNYSWRLAGMNYITILAHFLCLYSQISTATGRCMRKWRCTSTKLTLDIHVLNVCVSFRRTRYV
jgi:hypothetical protein